MSGIGPIQAVVYGVVQGLTEFLPVSSTAHLRIVQAWLNPHVQQDGFTAFTAVIQLGTMVAVLLYFWRELLHVAVAWLRGLFDADVRTSLEYKMGWYLILATVPVGVFGLIFSHQIETSARNLWVIAIALISMALVLGVAEQSLALIPGVSRSGATITGGLFRGLDRVTAARFSFLLSVPAVVLSGLFEARKIGGSEAPGMGITVVATIISFIVGLASIAWLINFVSKHSTFVFIAYRIAAGVVLIGLLAGGAISAT
jgi:undecaprenyl-diphosphatase